MNNNRKTVREWILSMKDNTVKNKIIRNMNRELTPELMAMSGRSSDVQEKYMRMPVDTIHEAFTYAFDLENSIEGVEYWKEIVGGYIKEHIEQKFSF